MLNVYTADDMIISSSVCAITKIAEGGSKMQILWLGTVVLFIRCLFHVQSLISSLHLSEFRVLWYGRKCKSLKISW